MVLRLRVLAIIRLIFEGAETYFLLIKYRNIEGARAPPAPPLTPSLPVLPIPKCILLNCKMSFSKLCILAAKYYILTEPIFPNEFSQ